MAPLLPAIAATTGRNSDPGGVHAMAAWQHKPRLSISQLELSDGLEPS